MIGTDQIIALLTHLSTCQMRLNTIFMALPLGFHWGIIPTLTSKSPYRLAGFEIDDIDDTGFVGGVELFPNYRINKYIAWGVNLSYLNSNSDFPVFNESMTSVSFEGIAESSPAYGMNWSARLSIGNYFPSEEDAFGYTREFGLTLCPFRKLYLPSLLWT